MKVFNLRCLHDHRFEGWFASETDFLEQAEAGRVECPLCGDAAVTRLPSAPRLNLAATQEEPRPRADVHMQQAAWLQAVRRVLENTEDVGERLPEEARRIHYGETPERSIRGRASSEETEALREEGIELVPLRLPPAFKGPVQ